MGVGRAMQAQFNLGSSQLKEHNTGKAIKKCGADGRWYLHEGGGG